MRGNFLKKVLITGGSGLLGLNWAVAIRENFHVILALHKKNISLNNAQIYKCSFGSYDHCVKLIEDIEPDIIIHAAGATNVEFCELNPEYADHINGVVPGWLAAISRKKNIAFAHISTDHLSSGLSPMSKEDEVVEPKNFYALSKRQGEINVLQSYPKALVIRTNFFGWGTTYRRSFSDFIIANLTNNQQIDLFVDVFYTPIEVTILAQRAMRLIEGGMTGILNIAGDERISKYDFGLKLASRFNLDTSLIRSSSIDRFPNLTSRPKDMSLDCDRARKILNLSPMTVDEQINVLFDNRNDQGCEEIIKL